jgi:hypothetical protein
MIGYVHDTTTIWRLWDTVENQVIQASNVLFDEEVIVGNSLFEDVLKSAIPVLNNASENDSGDEDEDEVMLEMQPTSTDGLREISSNSGVPEISQDKSKLLVSGQNENIRPREMETTRASENASDERDVEGDLSDSIGVTRKASEKTSLRRSERNKAAKVCVSAAATSKHGKDMEVLQTQENTPTRNSQAVKVLH